MQRRQLLQTMSAWGLRAGIPASALLAHSAGQSQSQDYKALVCIYLYGGNDGYNMLVPYESTAHANYLISRPEYNSNTRQGLGVARNALLPLSGQGMGSTQMGLHPSMQRTHARFGSGHVALLKNVGTLVEPVDRSSFSNKRLPVGLLSHDTQQEISMLTTADAQGTGTERGWGSRMIESMNLQGNSFTKVSFQSVNRWMQSPTQFPLVTGANQIIPIVQSARMAELVSQGNLSSRPLTRAYAQQMASAYADAAKINAIFSMHSGMAEQAFSSVAQGRTFGLYGQLLSVAKFLESRQSLNAPSRQIFFLGLGGFDTHEKQYSAQATLLSDLDLAVDAFMTAVQSIGLSNQVTAFTLSDFGRTLRMNASNGTDHAWASHHMVWGEAVRGGVYGRDADWAPGSADIPASLTESIIPSISLQQYAATLSKWFGVSDAALTSVFPELPLFSTANLGFMNS